MDSNQEAIRAVIVDDEPLARQAIRLRLQDAPDVEVVGEASRGSDAVDLIKRTLPDLLFLDVQIPDMNGFDVLDEVASSCLPIVVFVTAYDRYALKAFETHALDYLLKPFTRTRFEEALQRARIAFASGGESMAHRGLVTLLDDRGRHAGGAESRYLVRFAVKQNRGIKLVKVKEIDWIEAGGNYAQIHVGSACHLVRMTMQDLEQRLDPSVFARIHRSTIVNIDRVRNIVPVSHGDFDLSLQDGTVLRLSRNYRSRLQR